MIRPTIFIYYATINLRSIRIPKVREFNLWCEEEEEEDDDDDDDDDDEKLVSPYLGNI